MKRNPFKYKEITDKIIKGFCAGSIILAVMIFVLLLLASCQKVQLTEEEQKSFKGCIEPGGITQEDALSYLRILVKGDSETIRFYKEYEKSENRVLIADRRSLYQMDVCSMVQVLSRNRSKIQVISGNKYVMRVLPENKRMIELLSKEEIEKIEEGYKLILKIIKQKAGYPRARVCAIRAIKVYGDKRSIRVLKKTLNDKDPEVRLQAAGTLLSLGEGDIALPVLDELAKAGVPQSTPTLNKLFVPPSHTKLWDERGKEILIRALNYPSDEVKAFAALRLADMGIEKEIVEETAIKILERLRNKKRTDYKKEREWRSNRNAGYHAIAVLEKIESTAAIDILNLLIENNDDVLLQKRAKMALEDIRNNSPQSTTR